MLRKLTDKDIQNGETILMCIGGAKIKYKIIFRTNIQYCLMQERSKELSVGFLSLLINSERWQIEDTVNRESGTPTKVE